MSRFESARPLKVVDMETATAALDTLPGAGSSGPILPWRPYVAAVREGLRRRYGIPLPVSLRRLLGRARRLRLPPATVVEHVGRAFELTELLPGYWKRSS